MFLKKIFIYIYPDYAVFISIIIEITSNIKRGRTDFQMDQKLKLYGKFQRPDLASNIIFRYEMDIMNIYLKLLSQNGCRLQ